MSTQRRSAEYDAKKASDASSVISSDEEQAIIKIQIQEESGHQIKYRSCSWQKVSRHITHPASIPHPPAAASFGPRADPGEAVVGACVWCLSC